MADGTAIEWADATLNFIKARHRVTGKVGDFCVKVSGGCLHCYAETNNVFRGTGLLYKPGHLADVELFLDEEKLLRPLRWLKPRRIFPLSLTDLFADFVPDAWIDQFFAVAALTGRHTYMPLTKRAARQREYLTDPMVLPRIAMAMARITAKGSIGDMARGHELVRRMDAGEKWPLPNVILGVSAEDQVSADERVPELRATPAALRIVSAEPLIGAIDFRSIPLPSPPEDEGRRGSALHGHEVAGMVGNCIDWIPPIDGVIVGGESGPRARPMHYAWAQSIADQCAAAGTAFFFKQWGGWGWAPADLNFEDALKWVRLRHGKVPVERHSCDGTAFRVGKKRAGRLLNGREYNALPEALHG